MVPWPNLLAFALASALLIALPGPSVLFVLGRSIALGRRGGLLSVLGNALGMLPAIAAVALGIGALVTQSVVVFTVVKVAGAAYLVYLGIKVLRTRPAPRPSVSPQAGALQRVFRDGLVVALLNPKTTLFFAAFLPQFMSIDATPIVQGVTLGMLFVAIAAITDSIYAIAAGSIGPRLTRTAPLRSLGRYVSGTTFIGLGVFAALADVRRPE